jgi:hypothetical protein
MTLPVRTPGLAHVRISGTTFRRRLRQSELRARRPVVGPILKQRQRISRLACAGACVVGGFTPGNKSFLVMNPDFHFDIAMDVIVSTAGVVHLFTDQCVYELDRFGDGSVMVRAGICHDGRT